MKRWPALAGGFVAGLVLLAPARLLLPAPPLAADAITGPWWRADLAGAALGRARLGDVGLRWQPAAMADGRLAWQASGGLAGQLWWAAGSWGGAGMAGRLAGAGLPGLPAADIMLADAGLSVDDAGRCRSASGQVALQLATAIAGNRTLAGPLLCEAGVVTLPLASRDGRVQLDLALDGNGWQATLVADGAGPAEALALAAASPGMAAETTGRLRLERKGRWE
jgi:hypothetical protein